MHPTRIRVQPVAQGGMEAKIGAKKILWEKSKCEPWILLEEKVDYLPDEETNSSHDGCESRLTTFRDTGSGLDVCRHWRTAEEGANGNSERIDHVGHGGTLEIYFVKCQPISDEPREDRL
jgi:hypothetical protein